MARLSTCGIRNDCCERIEEWLANENRSVTSLNLWGNYLRREEVTLLLNALQRNKFVSVSTINLGSNRFGSEGVEALGA